MDNRQNNIESNKMKIIKAEKLGFCFGVREALKLVEKVKARHPSKKIYTLGMLVHNKFVMNELKKQNIKTISENDILKLDRQSILIIRAHGTTKEIYKKLIDNSITFYDATCPFVKNAKGKIIENEKNGFKIIFIGDKTHPEVKGIISFVKNIEIYDNHLELVKKFNNISQKHFVMCQTTFNHIEFENIKNFCIKNIKNIKISDTICNATVKRQEAVEKLSQIVDVVLIIGGKNSSNTHKLYQIAKEINTFTYQIESKKDISIKWFENKDIIGIGTGASTPLKSIQEVEEFLKGVFK